MFGCRARRNYRVGARSFVRAPGGLGLAGPTTLAVLTWRTPAPTPAGAKAQSASARGFR